MARPARVRMRARKPWVRLRRRLLGWKVRLLTEVLPVQCLAGTDVPTPGTRDGVAGGDLPRLRGPTDLGQTGAAGRRRADTPTEVEFSRNQFADDPRPG